MKTGAYHKLKMKKSMVKEDEENEDYTVDIIKSFLWKFSIFVYEIAVTLCIVSTITFWAIWSSDIYDFHKYDHNVNKPPEISSESRRNFRNVISILTNSISPFLMLLDF
jgi:hypothetical protein